MTDFLMPSLGADMTAGRLLEWRKQPGDVVHRGDIIAEVDTDKGVIEIEVFTDGTIDRLLVEPGAKVPVGTPLAVIRDAGAGPSPAPAAPTSATPVAAPRPERLRVSPLAARLAADLGIDPSTVRGTGSGGAITRQDVEQAATARAGATAPGGEGPPDARMRQAIAAAVTRSKREIPHYYVDMTIDLGPCMGWLAERNRDRPVADRLLYNVLLLKAVALTLHDFPELNARWVGDKPVTSEAVHLGVAIALRQGGLVAPALHDAGRKNVDELMRNLRDLVNRARTGGLRASELSDPTVTVTNLGDRGADAVIGVIYPPQVAILGFGAVTDRPWVVADRVVSRPIIRATLAADHRVSDGHRGSLFLVALAERLQRPASL